MERLEFTLPDFTRTAWVSDAARATWAPRLAALTAAWIEVEWRAVLAGTRRCAYTSATPEHFVEKGREWAAAGLNALPVGLTGVSEHSYSATEEPYAPGRPASMRLVLGRPEDTVEFAKAWETSDQERIGDLLGYPPCCREFFRRTWVDDSMVDTTWPMALAGGTRTGDTVVVAGPDRVNILWRWMGVRAVPHLPCSFRCEATEAFADALVAVGHDLGYHEEMAWLDEVLSWPVEWSALHGIAEIRTPILKVATRTDATARTYTVQRPSIRYPVEGAEGLRFPYQQAGRVRLTASRGFKRGLDNAAGKPAPPRRPSWYASDNGFSTVAAMDRSHQPVVTVVLATIADRPDASVLDLGCGNGALLSTIVDGQTDATPYGIEIDPARVAHAAEVLGGSEPDVVSGDVADFDATWWPDRRFDVALMMPGRLLEMSKESASRVLETIRARCDHLVVYAYGDWLERYGGLTALAREAGLAVEDVVGTGDAAAALANLLTTPGEANHGS